MVSVDIKKKGKKNSITTVNTYNKIVKKFQANNLYYPLKQNSIEFLKREIVKYKKGNITKINDKFLEKRIDKYLTKKLKNEKFATYSNVELDILSTEIYLAKR